MHLRLFTYLLLICSTAFAMQPEDRPYIPSLHEALSDGTYRQLPIILNLIDKGADVYKANERGYKAFELASPLIKAYMQNNNKEQVIQQLLLGVLATKNLTSTQREKATACLLARGATLPNEHGCIQNGVTYMGEQYQCITAYLHYVWTKYIFVKV